MPQGPRVSGLLGFTLIFHSSGFHLVNVACSTVAVLPFRLDFFFPWVFSVFRRKRTV